MSVPQMNDIYREALEHFRYQHSDVWRGQQFYTTLNVGIISAALAILRLADGKSLDVVPLFVIGIFFSAMGFFAIKRLRRFYLEALVNLVKVEHFGGYRSVKVGTSATTVDLSTQWAMKEDVVNEILANERLWVRCNVFRWFSISTQFMLLQIGFLLVNVAIIFFIVYGVF